MQFNHTTIKVKITSFTVDCSSATVLIHAQHIYDGGDDDDIDSDYIIPVSKVDGVGDCFSPRRPRRAAAWT